jgi:enamine deaminase RidA (YjgF/YER057c/UK114 family)
VDPIVPAGWVDFYPATHVPAALRADGVVQLTSYHGGLRDQADALLRVAGEFLDSPYPAWTAVGLSELFEPGAVVEIRCVAVVSRARR